MRQPSLPADVAWKDGKFQLSRLVLVEVLLVSYLFALVAVVTTPLLPAIITSPPIVLVISFVPGLLFLMILSDASRIDARWMVYALGTSLTLLMVLGLVINIILPPMGIKRPLSVTPLLVSISLLVALLAFAVVSLREGSKRMNIVFPSLSPVPLILAIVPFISIYGVTLLNRTGDNWLLLVALVIIAFLPMATSLRVNATWHGFGIWVMALGVLYHDALFVGKAFPGNPVVVRVWKAGRWVPGTESGGPLSSELLQHGTIFPTFAVLNDLHILDQMILVNPLFVSLIPVALFIAYREYIDTRLAVLAASTFVFAHPFYNQFPTAGRSATPVLFLALFAVTLSESEFRRSVRTGLALLFLSGVVFTHYGTSYFFLSAVIVASVGYVGIKYLDRMLTLVGTPDNERWSLPDLDIARTKSSGLLTWPLRGFFVTMTFAWYLFTNDARAFALFPRHFSRVLDQFVSGDIAAGAGRTGARLQRDYGSVAIETSKLFYQILGLLMIVGIAVAIYHRYYQADTYRFDDHFLVMGIVMLGLFGLTVIVRTWGGGRPMMITFVFTLVFVGVAVGWSVDQSQRLRKYFQLPWDTSYHRPLPIATFAVILALLFMLNSGVATAMVLPGSSPSNVPTSNPDPNTATDAATHAWLIDHLESGPIYGDNVAFGQTDWLLPDIVARTEDGAGYQGNKPGEVTRLTRPGIEQGYLLLFGHNLETGELSLYLDSAPMADIQPEYRENRVYSTGYSHLYFIDR